MLTTSSQSHTVSSTNPEGGCAAIEVCANGNRRSLEAVYLELCELAKQNGLTVEYRLTRNKPENPP